MSPHLCRYCGAALPLRNPRQRGRPAVTHPGECRRRYNNRRHLAYRIERFRQAHRLAADRSDDVSWSAPRHASDELSFEENIVPVSGAFDEVHGKPLLHRLAAWEKSEAARNRVETYERDLIQEERVQARRRLSESLAKLSQEERMALASAAKARRLARMARDE